MQIPQADGGAAAEPVVGAAGKSDSREGETTRKHGEGSGSERGSRETSCKDYSGIPARASGICSGHGMKSTAFVPFPLDCDFPVDGHCVCLPSPGTVPGLWLELCGIKDLIFASSFLSPLPLDPLTDGR